MGRGSCSSPCKSGLRAKAGAWSGQGKAALSGSPSGPRDDCCLGGGLGRVDTHAQTSTHTPCRVNTAASPRLPSLWSKSQTPYEPRAPGGPQPHLAHRTVKAVAPAVPWALNPLLTNSGSARLLTFPTRPPQPHHPHGGRQTRSMKGQKAGSLSFARQSVATIQLESSHSTQVKEHSCAPVKLYL